MKFARVLSVVIISMVFFARAQAQQETTSYFSGALKSLAISSLAGGFDVVLGRPFDCLKTMKIEKIPFSYNPKILYRGSCMNVMGLVPATGAQNVFAMLCKPYVNETSAISLAGGFSAVVACPADLIVLKMQLAPKHEKPNMYLIVKDIFKTEGIQGFYRGVGAIALREWGFTLAYMKLLSDMAEHAKKHINEPWNHVAAISIGGPLCSLLTHPMETIRIRQQQGLSKSMARVLNEMRTSELGLRKSLFAGFVFRSLRCTLAMAGLIKAKELLEKN